MADRDTRSSFPDEDERTTVEPLPPGATPAPPRPAPPRPAPSRPQPPPPPRAPAVSEPTIVGEIEAPLDTAVHRMPEPHEVDSEDDDAEPTGTETGTVAGRAARLVAIPELPPRAAPPVPPAPPSPETSDRRRSHASTSDVRRSRTSASDADLPLPIPYEPFGIPGLGDDAAARRWLGRFALALAVVVVVLVVRLLVRTESAAPGARVARSATELRVGFDRPPEPPEPPEPPAVTPARSAAPAAHAADEDDPLGEPPSRFRERAGPRRTRGGIGSAGGR